MPHIVRVEPPLVAEHLTRQERDRLSECARPHLTEDRLLIQLGALLEDATDGERRAFPGLMPLPARVLWAVTSTTGRCAA
ncbi:hypothetical protein GCM10009850_116980 [Nonomuraea monospora]|uniref:Uncharacterized protein n=1 Tax=Nonomuraea monospora TaxID=568818 RepID=A0ABN3D325_9ACTN